MDDAKLTPEELENCGSHSRYFSLQIKSQY